MNRSIPRQSQNTERCVATVAIGSHAPRAAHHFTSIFMRDYVWHALSIVHTQAWALCEGTRLSLALCSPKAIAPSSGPNETIAEETEIDQYD